MSPTTAERVLRWLLVAGGVVMLVALIPMVMPTDWMEAVNDELGLGPFHRSPLMSYLTRSLSAVYSLLGALALYVSRDVRYYLGLIGLAGWLTIVLAFVLLGIDLAAGMPPSWTWSEAPPTLALGVVIVWLTRVAKSS